MTPADHHKVIGIMHLIFGGFFTLIALVMLLFFGFFAAVIGAAAANDPDAPPVAFIWAIMGFVFLLYFFLSLPGLIAGYGMLKKKSWARMAGIISSIMAGMSFPFGTALCVYSLWYFFGDAGRAYEQSRQDSSWRGSLNQGQPLGWDAQTYSQTYGHERERAYQPPPQPPDWRNEKQ
jgi:apolipoprotein N-acyltransferase